MKRDTGATQCGGAAWKDEYPVFNTNTRNEEILKEIDGDAAECLAEELSRARCLWTDSLMIHQESSMGNDGRTAPIQMLE